MLKNSTQPVPDQIRTLYGEQRFAETVDLIRNVIDDPATRGAEWQLIANAATNLSDRFATAKAAERWLEEDPESLEAKRLAVASYSNANRPGEALAIITGLTEEFPASAHLWFDRGELEAQMGDMEAALTHLRRAWELDQDFVAAWQRIARLKKFEANDRDIPFILSMPERAKALGAEFELAAQYACADLFDSLGEPGKAIGFYKKGAAFAKKAHSQNVSQQNAIMNAALESFDKALIENWAGHGDPSSTPIFIIGPPRSGTTLIEQILSSHSQVTAGGETSVLRLASWPLKNYSTQFVKSFVAYGGGRQWRAMAERYNKYMTELFGASDFATNKDSATIASVGLINILFPKAKIIFCDRDARDIAWSCYKAYFGAAIPWANDFEDISRYIAAFRFTRREWKERMSLEFLNVSYEQLVANTQPEIDRILKYCDLPVEESCYRFYENDRQVTTASVDQVREPAHTRSVGSWRPYAAHLNELTANIKRFGLEVENS